MVAEARAVRQVATALFVLATAVFLIALYVGLVFWENTIDLGSGTVANVDLFNYFLIFGTILVLVLAALLILYFMPVRRAGVPEPAPEAEEWAAPAAAAHEPVTLDQPLAVREADAAVLAPAGPLDAEAEALLVRCANCTQEFEVPYTTERPLEGECPYCHEEFLLEEPEAVLTERGQPVVDIEGIGPVYARKLAAAGITTTEQLRVASVDRLAEQTEIPDSLLEVWKSMADFIRLKGIGKQYAEVLARAGVRDVDELAEETPERLASKVNAYLKSLEAPPIRAGIDKRRTKRWIDAARKMELDAGL